jgi:hypothetical protein
VQSACEDKQSTYERGTVRTLHYYIAVTDRVSLYSAKITTNSVQRTEACLPIIIFLSTLIFVCDGIYRTEKSLTTLKYFETVDLQTMFLTRHSTIKQCMRLAHHVTLNLNNNNNNNSNLPKAAIYLGIKRSLHITHGTWACISYRN